MLAITHDTYGSPRVDDITPPAPTADQVLIRVEAASLNAFDWHLYRGDPYLVRLGNGIRRPKNKQTIGADVAGEITAVGANVTGLSVGDRVAGSIGRGALAEQAVASPKSIARIPATLGWEDAAAIPMAGITALQVLRDVAALKPGQSVLINGASGGVGHLAVQLARELGASRVVGVCSGANVELVRSLGADEVIDYTARDFTRSGDRFDVVLDMIGNHGLRDIRRVLTPTGTHAIVGSVGGGTLLGPANYMFRTMAAGAFVKQRVAPALDIRIKPDDLDLLFQLADAATLRPVIAQVFPLTDALAALAELEAGHVAGKLVVTP